MPLKNTFYKDIVVEMRCEMKVLFVVYEHVYRFVIEQQLFDKVSLRVRGPDQSLIYSEQNIF